MKIWLILTFILFMFAIAQKVKAEDYKLFFGDLHGHTFWSDGMSWPIEYLTYCRDVAKLDFCAITDHNIDQNGLNNISSEANKFNSAKFVAFVGNEWTSPKYGHKCCYNILTSCSATSITCDEPHELYERVRKDGGLCHTAHPARSWEGQNATDWNVVKDNIEVAGEIYANEAKMIEAWNDFGLKLGVVGVSDTHDGRPGSSGVTGCYASELTRKGILEALKRRRCFATSPGANRTHFPMNLSFKINNHWMGEELSLDYGSSLNFEIIVNATYNITEILLKKNGKTVVTKSDCNSNNCAWFFSTSFDGSSYYYVVATTGANKTIWSSPIWLLPTHDYKKILAGVIIITLILLSIIYKFRHPRSLTHGEMLLRD